MEFLKKYPTWLCLLFSSPGGTYGMDKMKQKDAEERLKRMDTKQRRGSPTVRFFYYPFCQISISDWDWNPSKQ